MPAIRLIVSSILDPRLPETVIRGSFRDTVIIGDDLNRVRQLELILNAMDPYRNWWVSYSLRHLEMRNTKEEVIGRSDYFAFLKVNRHANFRNLPIDETWDAYLPDSDTLLERRLSLGMEYQQDRSGWARWLAQTDQALADRGIRNLDNTAFREHPEQFKLPISSGSQSHVVAVISDVLTKADADRLDMCLSMLRDKKANVTLVVESNVGWLEFQEKYGARLHVYLVPLPNTPSSDRPNPEGKTRRGHVQWEKATRAAHINRIHKLASSHIRFGGNASGVLVLTDSATQRRHLLTQLFHMGLPVQCSESELLPGNSAALDLMSLLASARNRKHLPSITRLTRHLPGNPWHRFSQLQEFFSSDLSDAAYLKCNTDHQIVEQLKAWHGLARSVDQHPLKALAAAKKCFEHWGNDDAIRRCGAVFDALIEWAYEFDSTDDLIKTFWGLRALVGQWSGYRPDSGIRVTSTVPADCRDIVVRMSESTPKSNPEVFEEIGQDVYHAPVMARPDSPEHKVD